ncbi:MAG: ThiF family adenylyltransferase, partial [Alphaproteobacteria bacterium]|nr:ThiF family adenylyltransferase [Alphaproteobacteria bacterium]
QLARLGVGELVIVDDDTIEERNLNRILNATAADAEAGRPKVAVLSEAVTHMGTGTQVITLERSLWSPEAIEAVAQCDIVFGCMDTIDGRFLLNTLATNYQLPYFDLGVRIHAVPEGPRRGEIVEVCGSVHYLTPGGSSLISRGLLSLDDVRAAGLARTDPEAHARQIADGYVSGVAVRRPAVISLNMLIGSLA